MAAEQETKGSFAYRNWKAALAGAPWQRIFEYPLFTDAHIVGESSGGLGPYRIINNVGMHSRRPALILRAQDHLELQTPKMEKTHVEYYHGGHSQDEIAALLSLCLGVRMKAGAATRIFGRDDPMGRPIGWEGAVDPDPTAARALDKRQPILKDASALHSFEGAEILKSFHTLTAENAIALVRSARLYQEAIWMVETTPELAWIMLTSAIETVAHQWRTEKSNPIERMRIFEPSLEALLLNYGGDKGEELVQQVASLVASFMGATKTFVDFIIQFLPPSPSVRPPAFGQVPWEEADLRKIMKQIYSYRSRALHGGLPFPAPMCEAPHSIEGALLEIPSGLATNMKGGTWLLKDTPMLLHTFEYIVRNVILNWWKAIAFDIARDEYGKGQKDD